MIQLTLDLDTTALLYERRTVASIPRHPGYLLWRCRRCGAGRKDKQDILCQACLAACPTKRVQGYVITLTATVYPHNWQELAPWKSDKRNADGTRRTYPMYWQDASGVVWEYVYGGMGRYERWH